MIGLDHVKYGKNASFSSQIFFFTSEHIVDKFKDIQI